MKLAMLRLAPHLTRILAWLVATACAAHAGEATEAASGTADQFKLMIGSMLTTSIAGIARISGNELSGSVRALAFLQYFGHFHLSVAFMNRHEGAPSRFPYASQGHL